MPPRLSHTKSTNGCLRCKARKVKCDEKRPKCSQCSRHDVGCEWPTLRMRVYDPQRRKPATALSQQRVSENPRPGLPSPELGTLRALELRLIHQWTTATADTMSSSHLSSVHEMWSVSAPQMAFEHEPLLHTLLAIGAAHRAMLLPNEAHTLRPVCHRYIHSAVRQHRPITGVMDPTTSEAVCLNAVLICLYTLILRSEPSDEPYEPPTMWLSMARGVRTVIAKSYLQLVQPDSRLRPLIQAQPTLWTKDFTAYSGPIKPFEFLLEYRREEEPMNEETLHAYSESVSYIERFYISSMTNEQAFVLRKMLNGFPSIAPQRFLSLVTEKAPRALVILAYLFALAKQVEDIWWLRGIPEREVQGINSILPDEWKWAMQWPLNLVFSTPDKGPSSVGMPLRTFKGRNAVDMRT